MICNEKLMKQKLIQRETDKNIMIKELLTSPAGSSLDQVGPACSSLGAMSIV